MNAAETVADYFDALTAGDADRLVQLIAFVPHFRKIGTDEGEHVEGGEMAAAYYRHHAESTEDFRLRIDHLDVQERDCVAWFYTHQTWRLLWQGTREQLAIRMTGVLEREEGVWRFVQIHASLGVAASRWIT